MTPPTSAQPVTAAPPAHVKPVDPRREILLNLAVNVAAPLAVFYGLRALGVGQWLALMLGVIPPGLRAVQTVAERRRVDALALFVLSFLLLTVAVSFLSGSPRFLLAKDGWMTGVAGAWILGTLLRTPFMHQFVLSVTTGAHRERAEANWRDSPTYRRVMRGATAIWGVGLVLDAGVRVVLAYALPVDRVPLISGVQYAVVYVILETSSQVCMRRRSVRARVQAETGREADS